MKPTDLLFVFGFFNLTPNLQMIIEHANELQTPIILVTDTLGDFIGSRANVVLVARRGPVSAFHSLTVPMTIINALLLALGSEDEENVMANLDKLDQLRDRLKKYHESTTS
jgi:DNA-binding MurR/RpiR family transcriptional regulator